jgi:hypothetical protein
MAGTNSKFGRLRVDRERLGSRNKPMWISIFAVATASFVAFSVAAILLQSEHGFALLDRIKDSAATAIE